MHRLLKSKSKKSKSTPFEVLISTGNEYGVAAYGSDYPWLQGKPVVEPFRFTTLSLSYDEVKWGADLLFEWRVTAPTAEGSSQAAAALVFKGSRVTTTFTALGAYGVEVVATSFSPDSDKGSGSGVTIVGTYATTCHCVYVKRELRSLTEEDRENFLDAMHTMWEVGTKKGREVYGNEYTGMDRFVSVHADQATLDIKCDRWHEGSGFLVHHLALALSFDMSLRAVDQRVITPYWDFTIEGEALYRKGLGPGSMPLVTPVLSSLWFGSVDAMSHVQDSRWAHSPALLAVKAGSVQNSYGIIRAPWNNAKDRELIRHLSDICGLEPVNKPIPTCATHFKLLNLTSLSPFLIQVAGYGHGPMHVNTGGVFGQCTGAMRKFYDDHAEEMAKVFTMKEIAGVIAENTGKDPGWHTEVPFTFQMMIEKFIHLEYFHIYRTLWRSQTCALDGQAAALQCPASCDEGTPEHECQCRCKGIDAATENALFDWENLEPCMYASNTAKKIFQNVVSEEIRRELITLFCSTGVKEGEQLESASPGDPIFWMIHPILDRILTAKRLAKTQHMTFGSFGRFRGFDEESWLDYSFYSSPEGQGDYVCEGQSMYDEVLANLALPEALVELGDVNQDGFLNNIEFYDVTDPGTGDGVTYIYDHFEWAHCDSADVFGEDKLSFDDDAPYTFTGGVNPTMWDGDAYQNLRPDKVNESPSVTGHRQQAADGGKPGPSLKREPKEGSKDNYDAVMAVLEANYGNAKSEAPPVELEPDGTGGEEVVTTTTVERGATGDGGGK